ncbi:MAG: DUF1048 domain-containing protein [Alphaproteobacteria bacterium]|nr:DUF1048 domain-containing protein [Alphaproteobacteria bacterium]MCB9791097.1 DUF1048 domain-containing protein [Alphaproteobacteria bacterium]
MTLSKFVSWVIGEKTRWWRYKARRKQLPPSHRAAMEALERYLMYVGLVDDPSAMFEDLVELFEQSAADGVPVREVVGEDPVEFVDAFMRSYGEGSWRIRERERLISAIDRAAEASGAAP